MKVHGVSIHRPYRGRSYEGDSTRPACIVLRTDRGLRSGKLDFFDLALEEAFDLGLKLLNAYQTLRDHP